MTKENKLSTFFTWFATVATCLLPVFFVPYFINPFYNSKLLLVFLIAFVTVFAAIIQSFQKKSWQFIKTPLTFPVLGFAIAVILSSLVSHQYPSGQFLGIGGVYLSFAAIILIAPSLLNGKLSQWFTKAVNVAALLLSLLTISQLFGLGLPALINRISILNLTNDLSFSLTGTVFVAIQFLSVVLLSNVFDQKAWRRSWFNKITTILVAVALGINIWSVLPNNVASFQNLSLTASASIAKDSLTLTKNALFGYGPDSYSSAFDILKPIWINGMDYWQYTFDSAFNFPLTLVVSIGVLGVLAYLFFLWKTVVTVNKGNEQDVFLKVFIFTTLIWQFFSPVNLVMLTLLAIALAFFIANNQNQYKKVNFGAGHLAATDNYGEPSQDRLKLAKIKNYTLFGSNAVLLCLFGFAFYTSAKAFVAYQQLYQSNVNINNNEIVKAYDNYNEAKNLAPTLDFIRRNNSLINLQIAIAMSNKTDITTAEQEQVLQLINQAITEAKAATVLGPTNYQNWLVLAQIYMQLLETTEQAQQEAFNALAQAINYNPSSPELRIIMGQLFLNSKDYANAVTFFAQAVERKGDLPSAHYYLAQALMANEQWEDAQTSLNNTLSLLEKDSEDYKTVEKDLATVNAQVAALKAKEQTEGNGTSGQTQSGAQGGGVQSGVQNGAAVNNEMPPSMNPTPSENANVTPAPSQTSASDPMAAPINTDSGLSGLLDQQETEAVIQDGALTPDQNLVEN
ncbi:MAG TPA: tetratricopeptide repeat protein [Candidatus Woesebacteria bacterium]|nr:tetratricopeptide repeat protein [Candidatus Woesebacteria bacterium]